MSQGRRPELIAAILAILPFYNTFIHTPPKSLFTKRGGTLSEPDPTDDFFETIPLVLEIISLLCLKLLKRVVHFSGERLDNVRLRKKYKFRSTTVQGGRCRAHVDPIPLT